MDFVAKHEGLTMDEVLAWNIVYYRYRCDHIEHVLAKNKK